MNTIERLSLHLPTSDVQRMVDFYVSLGFSLVGEIAVWEGTQVFALLKLGNQLLRVELWTFSDWEPMRQGFAATTLWIETDSLEAVADRLRAIGIPFGGPDTEVHGSIEIELFDPEGFRIIYQQSDVESHLLAG
jgi:catechol 2,3-dioxygenase-like lactoylglutathione lyase family enzyme